MSRHNLHNLHQISYYKPVKPSFDEYVFCRECRDYVYEYCSIHGPLLVLPDDKKVINTGAGIGVFSSMTLPAGVRFGPYRGKITKAVKSGYCWQIYDKDYRPLHVVDAADADKSNWMRYVNCSRHWSEQNLLAYQYKGQVYYRTIKTIPQFTELLVFYGGEFANILNVDLRLYNTPQQVYYENMRKVPTEIKSKHNPKPSTSTQTPLTDNMLNNNVTIEEIVTKSEREPNDKVETFAINKVKSQKEITNKDIQKEHSYETSIIKVVAKECESGKEVPTKDVLNHILKYTKKTDRLTNNQLTSNTPMQLLSQIYSCDICTYKTYQQRYLISHLKMHKLPKAFSCDVCAYKCSCRSKMERHIKIHTNDHFFRNISEYRNAHKSVLKEHNRTHTTEKAFSCDFCQYTSIHKSKLIDHIRTHTGEKPFPCNICEFRSAKKYSLKRHLETHY